ncbi:MAG: polysaccharide biosynthesis protein [Armatimonadetes bacterium]|nr:polysaccharide biosynthesis protein [Armatimonadota bacterium]
MKKSLTVTQESARDAIIDLLLIHVSLLAALAIANEFVSSKFIPDFLRGYSLPVTVLALGLLKWRGIYRINPRYMGLYDVANILLVGVTSTFGLALFEFIFNRNTSVKSLVLIPVLFGFFVGATLVGTRLLRRYADWKTSPRVNKRHQKKTLIIGAGDAGELIVREIARSRHSDHCAVGFIDDNPAKSNLLIHGVPVLGTSEELTTLVAEHGIEEVIFAIPSASGDLLRKILARCDQAEVRVRTLPPVAEILGNEHHIRHQLREVEIEDLLRREPTKADLEHSRTYVTAETVLITGGGGSIGSELARQIAKLNPANLILLGRGENSIYEIEQELIQSGIVPTCVIADIRDQGAMELLFETHKPSIVFHAAAHKHVPLMQANVIEAIRNNVQGTQLLAELAARFGARKFVYISTDKAVKPSSVMGATKRVGEMIVRCMAQRSETEFGIVRFGNVLGSRGSLIPVLKKQIRRGGPIRLTHPDMTRYFMTIPEAVQLILQAGAMGSKGELFILDMGDPIKIIDLAKDLIRLHGLVPGEDIEIVYTGIRPGEKIDEELTYDQEELMPTTHSKIRVVRPERPIDSEWLAHEIQQMTGLCDQRNVESVRQALMELAWGKSEAPFRFAITEAAPESTETKNPQ